MRDDDGFEELGLTPNQIMFVVMLFVLTFIGYGIMAP